MLTLADAATRAALTARIQALAPNAAARWGRMQAPEMLAHCRDSMRMAYGELYCAPKRVSLARLGVSKWLVLRVLPFPKGAPTAPELVARRPDPGTLNVTPSSGSLHASTSNVLAVPGRRTHSLET